MDKDEITPERVYMTRREIIANVGLGLATAAGVSTGLIALTSGGTRGRNDEAPPPAPQTALAMRAAEPAHPLRSELTPYRDITTYNNFYELGLDKGEPAENAGTLKPRPGPSPSKVRSRSRRSWTSTRCCRGCRCRSASIACAASKRGRW